MRRGLRRLATTASIAVVVAPLTVAGNVAHATSASNGRLCTIVGTSAADIIQGTAAADVICGLGGNDRIFGNGGSDTIDGGDGVDALFGGPGGDWLLGGPGNDSMQGGIGADAFTGGTGLDLVNYSDHSTPVTVDLDGVRDDGSIGENDLIGADVENLSGGAGGDRLTGNSAANVIVGGGGNDVVLGAAGPDRLNGGSGNDTVVGGAGGDTMAGDAGVDTVNFGDHSAAVTVDLDGVRDDGATGEGDLVASSFENLTGGAGNDTLTGSSTTNVMSGGSGNDDLSGGAGDDSLLGQNGDDDLFGQGGDDSLNGGSGGDLLDGGTGMNVCVAGDDPGDVRTATCDLTAPTIAYVGVSPATARPGDTVIVSAHVLDAGGVTDVGLQASLGVSSVQWCDSYGSLFSGSATDGVWRLTCVVPATANSGVYSVYPYAKDASDNWVNTNGGPLSDVRGSFTVVGGATDFTAPTIVTVTSSPTTIGPGDTVLVTARVKDASGVTDVGLQASLNGSSVYWCDSYGALVAGTKFDGYWRISCTNPYMNSGTYSVYPYARDAADNWVNTNGGPLSAVRGSFTVVGGGSDFTAPTIVALAASPSPVSRGGTVTVSARVTDATGVDMVGLQASYNGVSVGWCDSYGALATGTPQDGIWRLSCNVPSGANPGKYVVYPYARDRYGNWVNTNGGPLTALRVTFSVV